MEDWTATRIVETNSLTNMSILPNGTIVDKFGKPTGDTMPVSPGLTAFSPLQTQAPQSPIAPTLTAPAQNPFGNFINAIPTISKPNPTQPVSYGSPMMSVNPASPIAPTFGSGTPTPALPLTPFSPNTPAPLVPGGLSNTELDGRIADIKRKRVVAARQGVGGAPQPVQNQPAQPAQQVAGVSQQAPAIPQAQAPQAPIAGEPSMVNPNLAMTTGGTDIGAPSQQQGGENNTNNTAEIDALIQQYFGGSNKSPQSSFLEEYKKVYTDLGIPSIKQRYDDIAGQYTKLQTDLSSAEEKINDDPFLSAQSKNDRINVLRQKNQKSLDTLTNQLSLYSGLYKDAQDEAQFVASSVFGERDSNREFGLKLAEREEKKQEATRNLAKIDPSRFKEVQGGLFDVQSQNFVVNPQEKFDSSQYKEVQGGLYDVKSGKFVVSPKATGGRGGGSNKLLSVSESEALGVPFGTTEEEAYGLRVTGKPSESQSKARQFAVSADDANVVLSEGYTPGLVESEKVPNFLRSESRQKFEQASRAFVNSILRRESGATLTDPEFLNKTKELIPQTGDKKAVIEQKARARAQAVRSTYDAGGQGITVTSDTGNNFSLPY